MAAFAITATTSNLRLNGTRQGQMIYTVTNTTQQNLRARAEIVAEAQASKSWFNVENAERDSPVDSTEQFNVQVAVPPTVTAGRYRFRLDVTAVQNPDDLSAEGPWTAIDVSTDTKPKRAIPWLWIIVALGAVALSAVIGGLALFLTHRQGTLTAKPDRLIFNSVTVNTTSSSQTVTVTNTGSAATNMTPRLEGAGADQFRLSSSCPLKLSPGNSCDIHIVFSPTAENDQQAVLRLEADNASPVSIPLTGGGHVTTIVSGDLVVVAPDWTGFGHSDLLARRSDGTLWLYQGNDKGGLAAGGGKQIGSGWGVYNWIGAASNWTSPGSVDLLARKPDGTLWLFHGNGQGGLAAGAGKEIGHGWQEYDWIGVASNWTSPGSVDLLARKPDGTFDHYQGDGQGGFVSGAGKQIGHGWQEYDWIGSASNWTGAGKADVLARKPDGTLDEYPGDGQGGFVPADPKRISGSWQGYDWIGVANNWTHKGSVDLLARKLDGSLWLYRGDGKGGLVSETAEQVG